MKKVGQDFLIQWLKVKVREELDLPEDEYLMITAPAKLRGTPFDESNISTMCNYSYSGQKASQPEISSTVIKTVKLAQTQFTYK